MKTLDIQCVGYAVKTDVYEASGEGAIVLSLIGRTSRRSKQQYRGFFPGVAEKLGITSVVFDYSGHGDSPFTLEDLRPAQHLLEVVTVFDWIKERYPNRKVIVIGSSYGGFMAAHLAQCRNFEGLLLRAPAIYPFKDFYTKISDETRKTIMQFRHNKKGLQEHPLIARTTGFDGDALVIAHGQDEHIPKEVTDVYSQAFQAKEITVAGLPHSLDDATDQQTREYLDVIFGWLKQVM